MKKILVVGYGYVGKAMVDMLRNHYDVIVYDPACSSANNFENVSFISGIADANDCILSVICVPTPQKDDGSCDVSLVEKAVKELSSPVILIKSTIPPGTTERLKKETQKRIVFSPEYVGESKYYNPYFNTDMKAVPFLILGGDEGDCDYILDLFFPVLGPTKQYFKTRALNAEVTKYMENTFFATKITFVNEMYEICKALGADWYDVREGWLLDPRVERMHTAVFPEKRGFSGKCLPKDSAALVNVSRKAGYLPKFIEQMIKSNEEFKKQNTDT